MQVYTMMHDQKNIKLCICIRQITYFGRRSIVVDIETRYGLDGLRFEPR
jgi:hypothetical protein